MASDRVRALAEKAVAAEVRHGYTATLHKAKCHALFLEGMFGAPYNVATVRELQDAGYLSALKIKVIILKHRRDEIPAHFKPRQPGEPDSVRIDWAAETAFLAECERRNGFLVNLLDAARGNTLSLFTNIEHGRKLDTLASDRGYDSVMVYGGSSIEDREAVRTRIARGEEVKAFASYGIFSEGINIPRLDNVIFASAYKSPIRVMQSIGRGLRPEGTIGYATLYDVADDLRTERGQRPNLSLAHVRERIKLYKKERLNYTVTELEL